jgi:hypothetical protein
MGEKVKSRIPESLPFDKGVKEMRAFTREIDVTFLKKPMASITNTLKPKPEDAPADVSEGSEAAKQEKQEKPLIALRRIVGGGDEITLVCNARVALKIVQTYFESLKNSNNGKPVDNQFSACAGITIFNSHAPFSVAYEIAEKCCENGKKRRRKLLKQPQPIRGVEGNCYVDFFFMMSGVTGELDDMREEQYAERTNTPYCITGTDNEHDLNTLLKIKDQMVGAKRANVKALHDAALRGFDEFRFEVQRIRSQQAGFLKGIPGASAQDDDKAYQKKVAKIVYDIATVYDVWFREEEN